MKIRNLLWLFATQIVLVPLISPSIGSAIDWPKGNITAYIGSNPGGNVDASGRIIGSEMAKNFGVKIVPINNAGAGGGIAADTTFRAPHDGNTWTFQGSQFDTFAVMGLYEGNPKDWYIYPMVGVLAGIAVREDSPFKTFRDLLEAIRKNPGKITYGAASPSTGFRICMEIMQRAAGLSARFVPYPGSAPTQVALLSGDIQFLMTGIGEQKELLKGKRIRSLAVYDTKPHFLKDYGEIPAITDFLPELKAYFPFYLYIMLMVPADVPQPIRDKIGETLQKAKATKAVKDFIQEWHLYSIESSGEDSQKFFRRNVSIKSWLLHEIGVAKTSPEKFGIPKP